MMTNQKIEQLEKRLGIVFQNKDLIKIALTHRSFINENKGYEFEHNERIEFLGDAVLELIVTERLFANYPKEAEGILTSVRSATVRTETLAETARKLNYGDHLLMSKGEEATGGRDRDYILANTFESVLGAIYEDQGLEVCRKFLERELLPLIPVIFETKSYIDSKSQFQELAQEKFRETPHYELIGTTGPDHEKTFTMAVFIGDKKIESAEGKSKQDAEQEAAQKALENWDNIVE